MTKINRGMAAVTLAGAAAASLTSQANAGAVDYGALEALFNEPVTTSATGAPQRATEAPVNMTIITHDQIIQSGAIDIPGVLERLAHVDVMRSTNGQADVSIRGYNQFYSPRLLVLVNGRQVYLDHYGFTNWALIPVQFGEIRQIEVVSGPNTALFGFNAVAGVVNIITYDALKDDVDNASATTGDPTYNGASGVFTMRPAENVGLRFSLGWNERDASTGDDALSRSSVGRFAYDPTATTGAFNAAWDVSSKTRLDFELAGAGNYRLERFTGVSDSRSYTDAVKIGLSSDTPLGMVSAQVYRNHLDIEAIIGNTDDPIGFDNTTTVGSLALVSKLGTDHTLRTAGEIRHNSLIQGNGAEISYDVYALSGMWNWQVSPSFALTSAVRYDYLELKRSGASLALYSPNSAYDRDFSEWSYNIGGVYRVTEADSLRLSAARGVSSPSLLEYGLQVDNAGLVYGGNPDVSPGIVYNAELGWDHTIDSIDGVLRAAVFWQKSEDLHALSTRQDFSGFPIVMVADNYGQSEMTGFDVSINGRTGAFHWDASYSYRDIEDRFDPGFNPATLLISARDYSPAQVATAGVAWIGEHFEAGGDIRYTGETRQYVTQSLMTTLRAVDDYVQANARIAWKPTNGVQLELSGRDLLDDQTQTVGISPVERSVYLTLRGAF